MKKLLTSVLLAILILGSCKSEKDTLLPGMWRGVLTTESGAEIPFNFEINNGPDGVVMDIITGDYKYQVTDISLQGDSLFIQMPLFGSRFELLVNNGNLSGNLIRSSYTMPFNAQHNVKYRFPFTHDIKGAAAGRWQITLGERELIGEFYEEEDRVTGSFLTSVGDYRFFEGVVSSEGKLMLSCFDGGFIRLFTADISGDSLFNATMYTGFSTVETGSGFKNLQAQLPDSYSITGMKPGYTSLGFSFPDINGNMVSLSDDRFNDKVVVVQISGSWCPNCLDESRFLMEMYNKYYPEMHFLCLAFERSDNFDTAKEEAMKLADVAGIAYDILITGHTPARVREALPELENFRAFPTTIIIDKKGVVRRIHSGFSGPGTGIHYTNYVENFIKFAEELMAE